MSELRINARLDEQTASDLQFLREALGNKSITEVLKYSLQQMAQDLRDQAEAKRQKEIWKKSGLIGCIKNGPEDLSTHYKKDIDEYLDEKYAHHFHEK